MSDKCSAQVWKQDGMWGRNVQCSRKPTMEHDGQPFCVVHHPDKVKVRRDAQNAKYRAIRDAEQERFDRECAIREVCEGVSTEKLKELGKGWIAKQIEAAR